MRALLLSAVGAFLLGFIALHRGETISAAWLLAAALCFYILGYRFYAAWIAARVLTIDELRTTPAVRLEDGRDFVPTNRWIVFGHHFAAIAGPGPLVGPTLAAQFGYLPGTIWILIGSILGGCVQDMVVLFISTRRDGKSIGQMARDEMGKIAGTAALLGTVMIVIILIAVLALVVVKALNHSPWGTATVAATIPIAMFIGVYVRFLRVGYVGEATFIGVALLLAAVWAGEYVQQHETLREIFTLSGTQLAWWIMGYGALAAIFPVWLLLAPRDYLSTFLKLGTMLLLAIAIIWLQPELRMPALTKFIDGSGPIVKGSLFPFVFITIACGAISGFHALVASGTTPKLLANERDIRLVGYGSMVLESSVALMALIAACALEPGIYFAINSPAGVVGEVGADAIATINSWGFSVTLAEMENLSAQMGESSLFARTGGAPSLAVGMAMMFGRVFGEHLLGWWYHFAIMFEAVFILTTLDAGTRVARFMLQDALAPFCKPLGRTSWYPSVVLCSVLVVCGWGYFLYMGVVDPKGGINILWPLFGIANQMLAGMALCVATVVLFRSVSKRRYAIITAAPLFFVLTITSWAAAIKLAAPEIDMGYISAALHEFEKARNSVDLAQAEAMQTMARNHIILASLTLFFLILLWIMAITTAKICISSYRSRSNSMLYT